MLNIVFIVLMGGFNLMEKIIIDENRFFRTISRISHEIIEKHHTLNNLVIVGIKRRGAKLRR